MIDSFKKSVLLKYGLASAYESYEYVKPLIL